MKQKKSISAIKSGMSRDTHNSQNKNVEYTLAVNATTNNETGESLNIQNEPSNSYALSYPTGYRVIGFKNDILKERTYFFLTNPTTRKSSIGYIDNIVDETFNQDEEVQCTDCDYFNVLSEALENQTQVASLVYVELFNDDCLIDLGESGLNFDINFPAKKIEIKQEKLGTTLYWNDNRNPKRYLNISNIEENPTSHYLITQEVPCDDPIELSCPQLDRLLVFPKHNKLQIIAETLQVGGNLKLGTYEFYVSYCDLLGNEMTNYSTPTNPISIFDENNNILSQTERDTFTNFAIKLKVKNLDSKAFKYYKVVCVERNNVDNAQTAFIEGIHPTTDDTIVYTHSGSSSDDNITRGNVSIKRRIDFNKLNLIKPHYDKAKTTMVSGGRLWSAGLTKREEINLQPVVNLFSTLVEWQTTAAKQDLYKSAIATSKYKGWMRKEVQPFAFRFFFKDGDYTASFPMVGRPATAKDLEVISDKNFQSINANTPNCAVNERNKRWQIFNTASVTDVCTDIATGLEIIDTVKKSCTIENVVTIPSNTTTLELVDDYTNLQDYIEDNPDAIIPEITPYLTQSYVSEATSGSLIVGNTYLITELEAGDNFSNVGYLAEGQVFIATGTTPIVWSNSTVVITTFDSEHCIPNFGVSATSGELIVGATYIIYTLEAGDNFTNVGFTTLGEVFEALETTPTVWTNLTEVIKTNCDTPELESSQNEIALVVNESYVKVEAEFPDDYQLIKVPEFCNLYEQDFSSSSLDYVDDDKFRYEFMFFQETFAREFYTCKDRDYNFANETCYFAEDIINIISPSETIASYFHDYRGETLLADLQTTKTATEVTTNFTNKIHKGGLWYKANVNGREKLILEVSKGKLTGNEDQIINSITNPDKEVRISLFNKCADVTPFYSEIFPLKTRGIQYKIEVDYDLDSISLNDGTTTTVISVPNVFSNGNFIVVMDDPIYECRGIESWDADGEEQTEPLLDRYRTAPADACYSIATRDITFTQAIVSWDSINIDKTENYISACKFILPDVDECDPKPYKRGKFSYWESTETYPDNAQLYDSSNLEISLADLNLLSADKISSFVEYHAELSTLTIGTALVSGKHYLIALGEGDNFSNIGGFVNNQVFLSTAGGTPTTWANSNTIVREVGVKDDGNFILNANTDLRCNPIRIQQFPDNTIAPFMYDNDALQRFAETIIFPLGITVDDKIVTAMLNVAVANNLITQEQLDNIEGWEILRGDNAIHKSVIANGLGFDMYNYEKEDGEKWWYSNFPFNDLGNDKFHTSDKERDNLIEHPYNGDKNHMFSFLSPDLFLTKPAIPTEMVLEGYQFGNANQSVAEVEKHPKYTILGRQARSLATTLAIAEVILETILKSAENTSRQWFTAGTSFGASAGLIGAALSTGAYAIQGFTKIGAYRYEWLRTFRDLGSAYNFAAMTVGVGEYNRFLKTEEESENYLRGLSLKKYLKDGVFTAIDENDASRVNINNWLREDSVLLSTGEDFDLAYPRDYKEYDNNTVNSSSSKMLASDIACEKDLTSIRDVASPYMSLKNYIPDQWGTIDSIKWLTTNYMFKIDEDTECSPIFGGTVTISPFSWRRKTPLFRSTGMGQPDKLPFNYSEYKNIGYTKYYIDYEVDTQYSGLVLPFPDIDSNYNLDCSTGTRRFYVKPPSKIYLYSHGVVNFMVESEINCHFRYARKESKDWFYPQVSNVVDWVQEINLPMSEPNTFFYNNAYSFPVSNTPNKFLDYTYDKEVWRKRNIQPNAVIYSEQENNENDLTDPWKVFKPVNWYEFNTKFGELIDLKDIESNQFFARFENQLILHNAIDSLADRITPQNKETGTGGIFAERPLEFKTTDLGFAGSQVSEILSTNFGHVWIDNKRGKIFQLDQNGKNLEIISDTVNGKPSGMKQWFREHLPFKILKSIPNLDVDNKFKGIGINMWYDDRFDRLFITKRDYVLKAGILKTYFTFDEETLQLFYRGEEVYFDNTTLFKDVSWTISFKPAQGNWESYFTFYPDFSPFHNNFFQVGYNWGIDEGTLWNHTMNNSSFQVFQGRLNPFIVEYPIANENVLKMLNSLSFDVEAKRYQNTWDFSQHKDVGFNKMSIWNNTKHSGNLNLFPQKTLADVKKYPKTNLDNTQDILFTSVDGKHNVNYFFNRVENQNNNIPLWNRDENNIFKTVNSKAVSFKGKRILERIQGDDFTVRVANDIESRFSILLKKSINNETTLE